MRFSVRLKRQLKEFGASNVVIQPVDRKVFNQNNVIPPGCMYYGDEYDWERILLEKGKICPECKTPYPKSARYCISHGPEMIPLKEFEYRK